MRIAQAVEAAGPYREGLEQGTIKPSEPPFLRAPVHAPPIQLPGGGLNPFLRSPLPGITVASDSLRQFYRDGIPQQRVIGPSPLRNTF
jgi:hypothetical protein